jgi:hypothetical protein
VVNAGVWGILPVWVFLPLVAEEREQNPVLFRLATELLSTLATICSSFRYLNNGEL